MVYKISSSQEEDPQAETVSKREIISQRKWRGVVDS